MAPAGWLLWGALARLFCPADRPSASPSFPRRLARADCSAVHSVVRTNATGTFRSIVCKERSRLRHAPSVLSTTNNGKEPDMQQTVALRAALGALRKERARADALQRKLNVVLAAEYNGKDRQSQASGAATHDSYSPRRKYPHQRRRKDFVTFQLPPVIIG